MRSTHLFQHYIWLINLIQKHPLTLDEIIQRWMESTQGEGSPITRYTFIRYKKYIAETFGIDIECNRKTNEYYISNPEVLRNNSVQRWMLSCLSVSELVSRCLSLKDHILLEDINIERQQLATIIDAMREKRCISFIYRKYTDSHPSERIVIPCCIKLFRQRWYVIDYNIQTHPRPYKAFAFDRITNLNITDQTFELPTNFSADDIFIDSFGIFIGDVDNPQRIVIRAYGSERFYIRDLPLHHSQEVMKEGADYTDYTLFIRPSTDFIAELLSKGDRIEVISPISLRERVRDEHLKAVKRYQ